MRSLTYLNSVLTVLAVLLTLQLGVALQGGQATPITLERSALAEPAGIPNAGDQRKQMIDLLKQVSSQLSDLNKLMKSGEVRVRVEGGK
jgi:hypothetical protein